MRLEEYIKINKGFTITKGQQVTDPATGYTWIVGGRFVGLNKAGNPDIYYRLTEDIHPYNKTRTVSLSSLMSNYDMPDGKEG